MLEYTQPFFKKYSKNYKENTNLSSDDFYFFKLNIPKESIENTFVVPDGCIDILVNNDENKIDAKIYGFFTDSHIIDVSPNKEYYGLRLHPNSAISFLNMPLKGIFESIVDLSSVSKDRVDFFEKMLEIKEFDRKAEYICTNMNRIINKNASSPYLVQWIINTIRNSNGNIQIKTLSEKTGYSEVYIRKIFKNFIGMKCKSYCRIIRFQNAVSKLGQLSSSDVYDVIESLGYYDESHFAHEMKQFGGMTPSFLQTALQ